MNNNNRHGWEGIDIPGWIIVLALIFAFPLGVILLLLKLFSFPAGKDIVSEVKDAVSAGASQLEKELGDEFDKLKRRKKKLKKIKPSAGEVLSWFAASLTLLFSVPVASEIPHGLGAIIGFSILATLTAGFIGAALHGRSSRERYNCYRVLIGEKTYVRLSTLASMSGVPLKKVIRDIRRMINRGYLGDEAVIDIGNDAVFLTRDAAEEYERSYSTRADDITDKAEGFGDAGDEKPFRDRVKQDEYRRIILEIRRLNDEIADIAVSDRIYRIEEYTQFIFDYVKENPETKNSIRTFMNYYLPTTLKLLETYAEIEKVGVAGENMKKSKESIERTLELIADGFKKQLDMLYEMKNIDISSDIDVLETMMKKDGMIGSFGGAAAAKKEDE